MRDAGQEGWGTGEILILLDRRAIGKVGCWTGGIQNRCDSRQEGCMKGGMKKRRDSGLQDRCDLGLEGFKTGGIQKRRDA